MSAFPSFSRHITFFMGRNPLHEGTSKQGLGMAVPL